MSLEIFLEINRNCVLPEMLDRKCRRGKGGDKDANIPSCIAYGKFLPQVIFDNRLLLVAQENNAFKIVPTTGPLLLFYQDVQLSFRFNAKSVGVHAKTNLLRRSRPEMQAVPRYQFLH